MRLNERPDRSPNPAIVGPPEGLSGQEQAWYDQGVELLRAMAERRHEDATRIADSLAPHEASELLARIALLPAEAHGGLEEDGIAVPKRAVNSMLLQAACIAGIVAPRVRFSPHAAKAGRAKLMACAILSHMLDVCAAACIAETNAAKPEEECP